MIHAVTPLWRGGEHGEAALLRQSYERSLQLAWEKGCTSVAFPLLAAGNNGFPRAVALQTAIAAFSDFLLHHEMQVYLVVFGAESLALSEKLVQAVSRYIDENYVAEKTREEYGGMPPAESLRRRERQRYAPLWDAEMEPLPPGPMPPAPMAEFSCAAAEPCSIEHKSLEQLLDEADVGFGETLLQLIERSGKKNVEVYKRANLDKKHFSKIITNPGYYPKKPAVVALAVALELDLDQTRDLLARAGYGMSRSSKFDIIVQYFIENGQYDIFAINETLFAFDQPLLGSVS